MFFQPCLKITDNIFIFKVLNVAHRKILLLKFAFNLSLCECFLTLVHNSFRGTLWQNVFCLIKLHFKYLQDINLEVMHQLRPRICMFDSLSFYNGENFFRTHKYWSG